MSRFFMTIPEAVGLVLQSTAMRSDDGAFVLDMGAPVKIGDLASDLVTSLGLAPAEVERRYVGARPGEKGHESLWDDEEEQVRVSAHERIFAIRQRPRSLAAMDRLVGRLEACAVAGEIPTLLETIAEAVPSFRPDPAKVAFRVAEPGEKPRILIVDDDPAICEVIAQALEDGFEATAAHSARDAYERVQAEMPHLVLLDVTLPDESGFWLCHTLRADPKYRQVAIIFMTGYGGQRAVVSALEAGGDDYLSKPFQLDELRARVDAVLRRKALNAAIPEELAPGQRRGR
jgi:CheY-like chemotaxis protein